MRQETGLPIRHLVARAGGAWRCVQGVTVGTTCVSERVGVPPGRRDILPPELRAPKEENL